MNKRRPTYQELEKRLAAAEPIIQALKRHEVDAVVGEEKITFLLLKEVGEALLSSEAGFNAMFELPGIGIAQADAPAFSFARVNQKFCDIVGYSGDELLAQNFIGLTHPQDRPRAMKELARLLRGKSESWSIQKRYVRKDGSLIWVNTNAVALRDDAGRTIRILAMISDLTANKKAEQELRDRAGQLRRMAAELKRLKTTEANNARKSV